MIHFDGHGVYDGDSHLEACSPPDGYAAAVGDCDDSDASVFPEALARPTVLSIIGLSKRLARYLAANER